jgi:hypothetical protein
MKMKTKVNIMKKRLAIVTMMAFLAIGQANSLHLNEVRNTIRAINVTKEMSHQGYFSLKREEATKATKIRPYYRISENIINLNYPNLDGSPVTVVVFDEKGTTLYSDVSRKKTHISKRFDFSEVKGVYTVIFKDGNKVFQQSFQI